MCFTEKHDAHQKHLRIQASELMGSNLWNSTIPSPHRNNNKRKYPRKKKNQKMRLELSSFSFIYVGTIFSILLETM